MVIITVASLILLLITVFTLNDIFQGETFTNPPLTLVEASPEVKEPDIIMIIAKVIIMIITIVAIERSSMIMIIMQISPAPLL